MAPRGILAAALVLLTWTGLALAQEAADRPDYAAWMERASVAETIADRAQASTEALEDLRQELAGWRERFLEAQDANAPRIEAIEAQLATLGAPPAEGETEPDAIAERRAELNEQLQELRAPALRAEEAFTRADGIINQIDATIRARQAEALLELGPSPLNPVHWAPALQDLAASLVRSWRNLSQRLSSDALRAETRRELPVILTLAAIGILLIARGRAWSVRAVATLRGSWLRGSGLWRFLLSLGQVVLPLLGIAALVEAASSSELLGTRNSRLIESIPVWATILLGTWWLADQALNDDDSVAAIPMVPDLRRQARTLANGLAVVLVMTGVLQTLATVDDYGLATRAVLQFPLLAIAGLLLFQLGRVALAAARDDPAAAPEGHSDPGAFRLRLARLAARGVTAIAIAGPLLAAFGYVNMGQGLVYPAILTLALFGLLVTLQHLFETVFTLATGREEGDTDSLAPVLSGFVLALASLPVLALIWGARVADLTEMWARFTQGFVLGDTRIAPSDFLLVLLVLAIGVLATRLVQGALRSSVLPRTKMEPGAQTAIVSGLGYVGFAIAALAAISAGGLDLSSLAIVAGALSVGIGFGLRTVVENFVSGILLLIERPISEGDWIEVGGQHGIVKSISVRSTRIETFDRFDLIVPNADLISGQVRNYTRGNSLGRVIVPVGVAYGSDTRKVEAILLDIARRHEYVLMNPAPYIYFKGFGADAMEFEIRAILSDVGQILGVQTDMNHQIVERFADEGIAIPFPQRDIWLRNPEALSPQSSHADRAPETPREAARAARSEDDTPGDSQTAEDPT